MLDTLKDMLTNQYEAALRTLSTCIERCPDANWNMPVVRYPFSQVVLHTLIYADVYLSADTASFYDQSFHRENAGFFGDYEQLQDREPVETYDRPSILKYMTHCCEKARDVIAAETIASLSDPTGFDGRNFSRAELHVYNIRHIQHHTAQLTLRLRAECGVDIPWFGSGTRDITTEDHASSW